MKDNCFCNLIFDLDIEEDIFDLELDCQEYDLDLDCSINIIEVHGDVFDGDYVYYPTFIEQTALTRNKILEDNITFKAIEVSEVTNPSGGITVYIGR